MKSNGSAMRGNGSKVCKYCNSRFYRWDFLHCFDRMVTCGSVECGGKRRKELWSKKYYNDKNSA